MSIDVDTIIERLEWAAQNGLSEFVTQSSGLRIHIRRGGPSVTASPAPSRPDASELQSEGIPPDAGQTIDAPMSGICHLSADPGAAPFVAVGDTVQPDQTVCMIEAMKVMTSIAASSSGVIDAILVNDGASVEAGTALMRLRP